MSDAKSFEITHHGTGLKSSIGIEMHSIAWGVLAIGLIWLLLRSSQSERFFQVTNASDLGAVAQCLDTPGHEKCGASERMHARKSGFTGTRGVGPEFYMTPQEVVDAEQEAVAAPDDASASAAPAIAASNAAAAERFRRRGRAERLTFPAKHADARLETILRQGA